MKIVLNTSPIIFLNKIGYLHLLASCATDVSVPSHVVRELGQEKIPEFIQVKQLSLSSSAYVQGAIGRLHEGELSAMLLAQESKADRVILDDLLARKKAQSLGLKVMGTIGLLLLMNKRKLLSREHTWQAIIDLTQQHGMYLSPSIMATVKQTLFAQEF